MNHENYKTVRVRATIEYDLEVPENWTNKDIEFHRNDGTWCADSIVEELEEQAGTGGHYTEEGYRPCMCGLTNFEVLDAPERLRIRDPRNYL